MSNEEKKLNAMKYDMQYMFKKDGMTYTQDYYKRVLEVILARTADAAINRDENYVLTTEDISEIKDALRINHKGAVDEIERAISVINLPKSIMRYIDNEIEDDDKGAAITDYIRYRDENKFNPDWVIGMNWITRMERLKEQAEAEEQLVNLMESISGLCLEDDEDDALGLSMNGEFNDFVASLMDETKYDIGDNLLSIDNEDGEADKYFHPTHTTTAPSFTSTISTGEDVVVVDAGDGTSIIIDSDDNIDWCWNTNLNLIK